MSKIYVEDIYVCDLFKWLCEHIRDSGGDGAGFLICENYKEVANWYWDWQINYLKEKYNIEGIEKWTEKIETEDCVMIGDDQEYALFTNKDFKESSWREYVFVVKKECIYGFTHDEEIKKRKILPIKGE